MRLIILSILFLLLKCSFSQTLNLDWVQNSTDCSIAIPTTMRNDQFGNTYVAGGYQDSLTLGAFTLPSNPVRNGYLAKLDPQGQIIWAISIAGGYEQFFNDFDIDNNGNIYAYGYLNSSTATLGPFTLKKSDGTGFIVKISSGGEVLMVSQHGIGASVTGKIRIVDNALYLSGIIWLGSNISIGSFNFNNLGSQDVFVGKFDTLGSPIWVKHFMGVGGNGQQILRGIALTPSKEIIISGSFGTNAIYFEQDTLTNFNTSQQFIVKFTNSGNILWAKSTSSSGAAWNNDLEADNNGDFYVCGGYTVKAVFGATTFTTDFGVNNAYLTKYDGQGNVLWAKSTAGNGVVSYVDLVLDKMNGVHVCGSCQSSIVAVGTFTLGSNDNIRRGFFATYNTSGSVVLIAGTTGTSQSLGYNISADNAANIYFAGTYQGSNLNLGSLNLPTSVPGSNIFVSKWKGPFVGLDELGVAENSFIVFPNPGDGITTVRSKNEIAEIEVLDFTGKQVFFQKDFSEREARIDISRFSQGLYYILIRTTSSFAGSLKIQKE